MKRLLILAALVALGSAAALATPYEVVYDGSVLPEYGGWQRHSGGGGAIRTIEQDPDDPNNHFYRIDSRANMMIYDFSEMHRLINPTQPGEVFVSEWRVRILDNLAYWDQSVTFARDGYGTLAFDYYADRVHSDEEGWWWSISPGGFHTYHLESTDMIAYLLWIDGVHVHDGVWDLNSLNQSFVNFGDSTQGAGTGSLAEWDYFRFGVYVPEPPSVAAVLGLVACIVRRRG